MPPRPQTVTVVPTSQQRRAFREWAGPRRIATLPGNGFAVPTELLAEVPLDIIIGARLNGEIYLPQPGQVYHDAPPLDDDESPGDQPPQALRGAVVAGFPELDDDDSP